MSRGLISSSVEYLNYRENKAEGRRQRAEGKEEGCKVERNDNRLSELDINQGNSKPQRLQIFPPPQRLPIAAPSPSVPPVP